MDADLTSLSLLATRWTRTGTHGHNTTHDRVHSTRRAPSCLDTALAGAAAATDMSVADHRRVRIAIMRFPAAVGSATARRPTLHDLHSTSTTSRPRFWFYSLALLLQTFRRPLDVRLDVHYYDLERDAMYAYSGKSCTVARKDSSTSLGSVHSALHSRRSLHPLTRTLTRACRAPLVWRDDGEVRFRAGSKRAPWYTSTCSLARRARRKRARGGGRTRTVPAEELVDVLLKIELVAVLGDRRPSRHARGPSDKCGSSAVIVSAIQLYPSVCIPYASCAGDQHTCRE
jgi:hypothetical protein